jgi:hypothetical protein
MTELPRMPAGASRQKNSGSLGGADNIPLDNLLPGPGDDRDRTKPPTLPTRTFPKAPR